MSTQRLPIHGVLLLGGKGTRVRDLTHETNKHLLVIGGRRVVEHNIDFLIRSGISDITMVVNPQDESLYRELLGENRWDASISVVLQGQPLGTAHAIGLCASSVCHDYIATLWGDNLFEYSLFCSCKDFLDRGDVSRIHLATVPNPQDFGVVALHEENIVSIEDKPSQPKAYTICTGFMLFGASVFNQIDSVMPNHKQERDMMEVVRQYLHEGDLKYTHINGHWFDIGTSVDAYREASSFAVTDTFNKSQE